MDRIRSGAAHSESSFIEKDRRQCRGEIDGQHLRRAMRNAVESGGPDARRIIRVRRFVAPPRVDFISRIEVVIDFEIELLAYIRLAEAKAIRAATGLLHPTIVGRVQAIADFVVIRIRHRAQHLFDIARRIHLAAIRIPGGSLNDRV